MHIKPSSVIHLLHQASFGVLATQSLQLPGYPYATILPFAVDEHHCPLLLMSGLAEHTRNLMANHHASLLVSEPGEQSVLNGARLTIIADAQRFDASDELAARYLRYQPDARQYLGLGDFSFFRLTPKRLRYIAGFGEMGWVKEADWQEAEVLSPSDEEAVCRTVAPLLPNGMRLLGIDAYGFDIEHSGKRSRHRFADAPVQSDHLAEAIKRFLVSF